MKLKKLNDQRNIENYTVDDKAIIIGKKLFKNFKLTFLNGHMDFLATIIELQI